MAIIFVENPSTLNCVNVPNPRWVPGSVRAFWGGAFWGFRAFEQGKVGRAPKQHGVSHANSEISATNVGTPSTNN